ncbi:MAG: RNA repair transcriptional activator RtcR family protein [Spirochaetota bacterium]
MNMYRVLFSFVGNRDPYVADGADFGGPEPAGESPGPVLSLLNARSFERVVLFCTGSEYIERARSVQEIARDTDPGVKFNFADIELSSPIDYQEIYRELKRAIDQFMPSIEHLPYKLSVLLDPGTPPMQTCWFLLVTSGYLPAELLQGVPARYAGGTYRTRTVELNDGSFPHVFIQKEGDDGSPRTGARDTAPGRAEAESPGAPAPADTAPSDLWIKSSETRVIGSATPFRELMDTVLRVAQYDVSVVIRGETGTGKEVVARLLHESSPRRDGPFVAVNCASIAASLAESELFGHEKGAFTGANTDRLGQFRAADGGTLFLDEFGDLPTEIQPKLLRALEDHIITPVGADSTQSVNVRVIAATNQDIDALIERGAFRRDLYERLNQVHVVLPPLRERPEDIPLLARQFVRDWNERYHEAKGMSEETMTYLADYPWPGNVRELQNTVTNLCAMGRSGSIGPNLLPQKILRYFNEGRRVAPVTVDIPDDGMDLRAVLSQVEREFYERALEMTGGNAERAAPLLGLKAPAFRKAMRERFNMAPQEDETQ